MLHRYYRAVEEIEQEPIDMLQRPVRVENVYPAPPTTSATYVLECTNRDGTLFMTNIEYAQARAYAEENGSSGIVQGNIHHIDRVLETVEHFLADPFGEYFQDLE